MATQLINPAGRLVEVHDRRVPKLLDQGYRRPKNEPVPAQEGESDGNGSEGELPAVSSLKKSEWIEMAEELGRDVDDGMIKAEIREAIASG